MRVLFITLLLIVASSFISVAQNDTIWFDKDWDRSTVQNATFYRPAPEKVGEFYKIKDYYIDGTLQMTGTSRFKDSVHLEGKAVWFKQNGEVNQKEAYKNNILDGVATYYRTDTKKFSREITYNKGDKVIEVFFDKNREGIRYKRFYKEGIIVKSEFYDKNGELIGDYDHTEDNYKSGKMVSYYYNPMRVKSIEAYENGLQLYFHSFYKNGQKQVDLNRNKLKEIFYNQKGQQLGVMQYTRKGGQLYYQEGETFDFYYHGKTKRIASYADGYQTNQKEYNLTETLIREEFYEDNKVVKVVSYTNEGDKIGVLDKKNDILNGTIRTKNNHIITYENNVVQKVTIPYYKSNQVFVSLENSQFTYYDSIGNKLGSLKVKLEPGEFRFHLLETNSYSPLPIEGTLFERNINNQITKKIEFKDSKKTSETKYFYYHGKTNIKKHFFDENEGVTKTIDYFSNGEIQSITNFMKGANNIETTATFFDKTGSKLSEYDFKTNTGTLYKYFPNSDQVKSVIQKKNEKLLKRKSYERFYYHDLKENKVILREVIDFNKAAKFYSKQGDLIAEATFNDRKLTGTIYDFENQELIEVKNGENHGKYISFEVDEITIENEGYYKNGKKHGTFTYSNCGIKQKEENFKAGIKEGYTIYYDKKGEEKSRLLYKNGEPFEGRKIPRYGNEVLYENGKIIKEFVETQNFSIVITYRSEAESNTIIYNKKDEKLISYTEMDENLQGDLIYYKNNEPDHIAVFENGTLINGVVWIRSNSRFGIESYARLSRENNNVSLETYNDDHNLTFKGSVKIDNYEEYKERVVFYRLDVGLYVSRRVLFLKEYGEVF